MANPGRQIVERAALVQGAALNIGGRTIFSKELATGEGWHRLLIRIRLAVTIGTGTTPKAFGPWEIIRNLLLRTDRGEIIANAPGRFWYYLNWIKNGVPPRFTTLAAATATYDVTFDVPFVDYATLTPNDTILDTGRYNSVSLELNLGTISDLFSVVGTATVAATCDISVVRTRGLLPKPARPRWHIAYDFRQPVDANTVTSIELERSPDMAYKRLLMNSMASGTAGLPFYGTAADTIIDKVTLKDQSTFIIQDQVWNMTRDGNANDYGVEATAAAGVYQAGIVGLNVFDFIQEQKSIHSSLYSGDKSILQLSWTNATAPANSIITLGTEAIRELK